MTGPLGSSKATTGSVVGGVFNLSAPLPADGQSSALQLDSAGNLLVNVAVGGGGGGSNLSVGVTGATAPTSATEIGTIDGTGKLQGVSATNPLPISGSISATNPSVGTTNVAAPTSATEIGVIDGTGKLQGASSTNPVRVDPTGTTTQPVSGSVSVSNFPGTQAVTLPAGQAVELLDSAGTNKASISAAGALKTDGSAVTQPVSGTFFQGTQPVSAVSLPLPSGAATDASVTGLQVAQASATAGEKGPLVQGAVTTAAPTYTTGQTDPLSLNTAGGLRVDGSGVTQPVSIAATVSENLAQVGGGAVVTAAAGVQKVGVVGGAGTSLETTAGVLDENIKNVGNSAVVTAAAGVQKVGIVGNAGASVDSTAAAGAAPTNAVLGSHVFNTTVPAPTAGQSVAQQCDSVGSLLVSSEGRKASYNAAYRLADATAGQLSLTFTFVANTNKQLATIYHPVGATKNVKIHFISITPSTGALGVFDFEVRALSAATAPATGNPAITPGKFAQADAAAEATCLALPTTAGSLVAADSPVSGAFEWNSAAAAASTNPGGLAGQEIVLFNDQLPGVKPLIMRPATAEGYAVNGRSSTAVALRFAIRIVFTEE